MRDIQISKRDNPEGKTQFSVLNFAIAQGVSILVEKVSKAVYSKTKSNALFNYVGADIGQVAKYSTDCVSLGIFRTVFSLALREIEADIIRNTPVQAPQGERLKSLVLQDLYIKEETVAGLLQKVVYAKLAIVPVAGSVQYATFSADDKKW